MVGGFIFSNLVGETIVVRYNWAKNHHSVILQIIGENANIGRQGLEVIVLVYSFCSYLSIHISLCHLSIPGIHEERLS